MSPDLPAWAESCKWLSDPKNQSIDPFGDFVYLAASRNDPRQMAQLDLDPLLAILETSTNHDVQQVLCNAVSRLAPRLESAQVKRAWDALITRAEIWIWFDPSGNTLKALAPRLEPTQVKHAGDGLIAMLEESTDKAELGLAAVGLTALTPRLEPAQIRRVGDAMIRFLEKSSDNALPAGATIGLLVLAPRSN